MYLMHHGIKGQKWGVRRYQNSDGTLTAEGKMRYSVLKTSDSIRKKTSLKANNIDDEPIDKGAVKKRGSLTDTEADKCVELANNIYDNAKIKEPKITSDVINAVSYSGTKMYGLDHRLKTRSSIAAKIGSDSKNDGISFDDASKAISDAIRYTAVSDTASFTKAYRTIKSRLELSGYSEIKCKNYFTKFKEGKVSHKAIQSVFSSPDGTLFELQFQTPQSQAVKELKLPLYNEVRNLNTTKERRTYLINQMNQLGRTIDDPDGVFDIEDYSRKIEHSALIHRTKPSKYIYISRS